MKKRNSSASKHVGARVIGSFPDDLQPKFRALAKAHGRKPSNALRWLAIQSVRLGTLNVAEEPCGITCRQQRLPLSFDCPPRVAAIVKREAMRRGVTAAEFLTGLILTPLADQLSELSSEAVA